jgi:hypothetical protein
MKPHLLPMHYRLGRLLGMRPEDVKRFYWEAAKRAAEGPQPAVVAGTGAEVLAIVALVSSAISVGLTIVAQFFRPSDAAPGRLKPVAKEGRTISDGRRYAPRDGFDALQDVAPIGERMPIVFALRETIDGVTYGGIRVNTPLLWSQIQTVKGRQLLRAIFLISDGRVGEIDPNGFALGNNLLNAYNLGPGTELGASYVAYARLNGGRIRSANRIAGKQASLDPGNAQSQGADDVFQVRSINNEFAPDFCSVIRPSTNTTFGVHSPIGNNLGYRVNPVIKPKYQAQLVPKGDDGDSKVKCQVDEVAAAQRRKAKAFFSTRSGLISGSASEIGNVLTYVLDKSSDVETDFGRALDPGAWGVEVEIERLSGGGTNAVGYSSIPALAVVSVSDQIPEINENALKAGIQWLNGNTVVPAPVVTINDISPTKIELTTRLQYDSSGLTAEQKGSLLYTRFKLVFVNSAVDVDDEPSAYYRVSTKEVNSIPLNYSIDFSNQTSSLSYGDKVTTYEIKSTLESRQNITVKLNKSKFVSELAADVASTIAGKQEQWDDSIQLGALYKIGTALAVCSSRSPEGEVFYSEAGFEKPSEQSPRPGQSITAQFTVVRPGVVGLTSLADLTVNANEDIQPNRYVGTNFPHIFRIDIANVTTTRPTRVVEIGIRSNLGIRINGLCNFRDTISYGEADNRACLDYKGDTVSPGGTLKQYVYTSGSVTTSQMRYSFFRIRVRLSGSSDEWIQFQECFCFRGISQQNQFNTIRLQFPSVDQWEIELEPLSGWEIRSGNATGTYVLIDGKRESGSRLVARTRSGVTLFAYGVVGDAAAIGVGPSTESFRLPAVRKPRSQGFDDLNYGYTDDDGGQRTQFVDVFGALAETFVFSEVTSTAESGPEHEIVFVNEIIQNSTVPLYPDMAISALSILPGNTFQQLGQHSVYVNAGYADCRRLRNNLSIGSSHLFPDIALELLTNPVYGNGDEVSDDQIDFDGFLEAANWCYENRYFCDIGYTPQNIMEWIAQTAEQHLLLFFEIDGKFTLKPMFPYVPGDYTDWTQKVEIKGVFGLLQMKAFSFAAINEEDRKPVQASGKWREERKQTNITNPGIFPNEREILLREAGSNASEGDPIVSFDLSDFATNEKHLIDYLKSKVKSRRLSTHGCTIELTQDSLLSPLRPGDYVQIPVEMTFYSEFRTGIVRSDGILVATEDIAAGTYRALLWNGQMESSLVEDSIVVNSDGTAFPKGVIFSIKDSSSDLRTYRILDITPSENAGFTLELLESPITSDGRLVLSQNWGGTASDSNWEISK